jgi:hypothetical protein
MNKYFILIGLFFLNSCNSESALGLKVKYFKNAIEKSRLVGDYIVSCRLKNVSELNNVWQNMQTVSQPIQLEALLHIDLKEGANETDVMMTNLASFEEYKFRVNDLNFNVMEDVTLDMKERSIHPILTNLENTYGLSTGRTINLVFNEEDLMKELSDQDELRFTYTDQHFGTGIHHFSFSKEEVAAAIN